MSSNIIETTNLVKKFGDLTVVDNLNLKVPAGKVFGFLGPNGAGKSTTFKLILGLIQPTSGNITVLGKPLKTHRMEILKKVGSMVDYPSYYGNLTAYENLDIAARILELDKKEIERALKLVELWEFRSKKTRFFSTGMKQRLGIAGSLIGNPDLLVLDEPINGLDPSGIHEMRELILSLPRNSGITVIVSSHILSEVEQMADSIGIIQKGRLIFQGGMQELKNMSSSEIILDVRPSDKAVGFLSQNGYTFEKRENLIAVTNRHDDNTMNEALLNRSLVNEGLDVYHISRHQGNLEDIFMKITGKETAV